MSFLATNNMKAEDSPSSKASRNASDQRFGTSGAGKRDATQYLDAEGNLQFYYLDAVELTDRNGKAANDKDGPKVLLFGKVASPDREGEFVSCCVTVKKLYRHCYFHKARQEGDSSDREGEYVDDETAETEIQSILSRQGKTKK